MSFGQAPGPPATSRQVKDLTALVQAAGHVDFRDARGPLGLSQRQAGGKFTRDEADELIARLEQEADQEVEQAGGSDGAAEPVAVVAPAPIDRRQAARPRVLAKIPSAELAAELQGRGWIVMEP